MMNEFINSLKFTQIYELFFTVMQILRISHPQFNKQTVIRNYAKEYKIQILIETGTYLGTTIKSIRSDFSQIYSIEIDRKLYLHAKNKFKNFKKIRIIKGDSSIILPQLLKKINKPCLFWLDAHFSKGITSKGIKDTPIWEELIAILNHKIKNHVILIDDADCFTGKNDYPVLPQIEKLISKKNISSKLEVKENIIRITPKYLTQKGYR